MTKTLRKKKLPKRFLKPGGFGVDESLLKLFPKTSPMGYPSPSRWTRLEKEPQHTNPTGCHYPSVS
jgi:hypothetical protein